MQMTPIPPFLIEPDAISETEAGSYDDLLDEITENQPKYEHILQTIIQDMQRRLN
jgi:hypothetical protein